GHTAMSSGRGVQVNNIRRIADDFVNRQLWRATSHESFTESQQKYVSALETLMASEGSNISGGLDNFYAALSEATSTPDSIALRQQILNEARNLAQRVNSLSNNIETQLNGLRGQREAIVVELNGLTDNLATLNKRITHVEASNGDAKALRDQRDKLVQDLAELADVRVMEAADGSFSVSLANGQPLVAGPTAATVKLTTLANNHQDFSLDFAGTPFPMARDGWGGQLGGLHDAEYNSLRATQETVSEIAKGIADIFNSVMAGVDGELNPVAVDAFGKPLTQAWDINGTAAPWPNEDQALFKYDPNSISQILTINDLKPEDLSFSSNQNEPGNNDKLLLLLTMKGAPVSVGGTTNSLNDAYATLLGGIASQSRQGQADVETATSVLKQAQAQRDSISAVNLDEEGVNLMNYQQAYQANLKVITTAGALFDSVLGMF
ncbi:MAG TPA: flagellar hook-associated protein FlgK, partial [Pseudomonas sp.]|nr:flagellar hook-associated protein FlgK [Pseudomonas sp.]